jgi:hypothetical protein
VVSSLADAQASALLGSNPDVRAALAGGYHLAFLLSAACVGAAALIAVAFLRSGHAARER